MAVAGGVGGGAGAKPPRAYGCESRQWRRAAAVTELLSAGVQAAAELLANAKQRQRVEASRAMMDEMQQTLGPSRKLLLRRDMAEQRMLHEAAMLRRWMLSSASWTLSRLRHYSRRALQALPQLLVNMDDKVDRANNRFDGGAEMILSALQQHQDDHGNGTFSSASVWSQLIERDAAQLNITVPCDRFSKVWIRASAEDKGVIWRTLIKVLQRTPFLVGYRFLRLLPGDKPPDTATASGLTPWRKERGQTVDVPPPPPPPPPAPFDRLVYVNAHGFNDFEVNGGILSDAYEAVHTMSPRLREQLRPLLVNKHTAFDEWEDDEKAQLSTIILRLCELVHRKEDETGALAGILGRIHEAMYGGGAGAIMLRCHMMYVRRHFHFLRGYGAATQDIAELRELTLPTTCYPGDENAQVRALKAVLERVIVDITVGGDRDADDTITAMRSLAVTAAMVDGRPEAYAMMEQQAHEAESNIEAHAAHFVLSPAQADDAEDQSTRFSRWLQQWSKYVLEKIARVSA
ncbi:hypothetical protein JKP88DRAFT_320491 [Tribonema minus]|uniref:Uncharacterized protein n=1 Tax=Tribonema minus TaxID=303371 RepID=A0A835YUC0_9STRA|nr:hypothetical protein JKP88DRAFT_320491 [Tribonema minus]